MINIQRQSSKGIPLTSQRSYGEIVEFLDQRWSVERSSLDLMKKLDKQLGSPSKKIRAIFVTGTNGKSLTAHFLARLLKEEGISAGVLSTPHILTYNERICLHQETITNKQFTDIANEVITAADALQMNPHALEVLTMMAIVSFSRNLVDVGIFELSDQHEWNPAKIVTPVILGITRVTQTGLESSSIQETIKKMIGIATEHTWIISADQSKLNLQLMTDCAAQQKSPWAMPIRKLALLAYPFEQLHGRCAALAERIAHILINDIIMDQSTTTAQNSLLLKQKGHRGRPTLEAKRLSELNPKRTLEQFWKGVSSSLPGRFDILKQERPSVLLDNSSNIDALHNLLLGIRLLHYQHPIKGIALIVGAQTNTFDHQDFIKLMRYFFKKNSGTLILCPVTSPTALTSTQTAADVEKIAQEVRNAKIKTKLASTIQEAFESARKLVDDRHGLIVITGSNAAISQYWQYKEIKKLS